MAVLDNYLSIRQLADEVGVTIRTLHRWHAERIGPARTKIGQSIYYSKDDVPVGFNGGHNPKRRTLK